MSVFATNEIIGRNCRFVGLINLSKTSAAILLRLSLLALIIRSRAQSLMAEQPWQLNEYGDAIPADPKLLAYFISIGCCGLRWFLPNRTGPQISSPKLRRNVLRSNPR